MFAPAVGKQAWHLCARGAQQTRQMGAAAKAHSTAWCQGLRLDSFLQMTAVATLAPGTSGDRVVPFHSSASAQPMAAGLGNKTLTALSRTPTRLAHVNCQNSFAQLRHIDPATGRHRGRCLRRVPLQASTSTIERPTGFRAAFFGQVNTRYHVSACILRRTPSWSGSTCLVQVLNGKAAGKLLPKVDSVGCCSRMGLDSPCPASRECGVGTGELCHTRVLVGRVRTDAGSDPDAPEMDKAEGVAEPCTILPFMA